MKEKSFLKCLMLMSICLLAYKSNAQFNLSDAVVKAVPDSLKPKKQHNITFYESALLLENFIFLDQRLINDFISFRNHVSRSLSQPLPIEEQIFGHYGTAIFDFQLGDDYSDSTLLRARKTVKLIQGPQSFKYVKEEYISRLICAVILSNRNEYELALDHLNLAQRLEYKIKDKDVVSGSYKTNAYINSRLNLSENSIQLLKKAERISLKSSDLYLREDIAYIPYEIASNYFELFFDKKQAKYLDSAKVYVSRLKMYQNISPKWHAEYWVMKGYVEYSEKRYLDAWKSSVVAQQLIAAEKTNSPNNNRLWALQGLSLIKLNQPNRGISFLIKQQKKPDRIFYNELSLVALINTYEKLGDIKSALLWQKKQLAFYKQENILFYRGQVYNFKQKTILADKEKDIKMLELASLHKAKRNRIIMFSTLSISLLISSFLYYRHGVNKKNKKRKENYLSQKLRLTQDQLVQLDLKIDAQRIEAALQERIRIGRNLHDNLSGSLTALKYLIEDKIRSSVLEQERINLGIIEEEIATIYSETRNYSHSLTQGNSSRKDFFYDIDDYLNKIKVRFEDLNLLQINLSYNKDEVATNLSAQLSEELYFLLKECFSNTIKHSGATKIFIIITFNEEFCEITFKDNGIGFKQDSYNSGIGLNNIAKRISNFNGSVSFIEDNSWGAVILIQIPLAPVR